MKLTSLSERGNSVLRVLDRYAGIPLTPATAIFRKFSVLPKGDKPVSRIGIICLGAIGDMLLASALANGLKTRMPAASIEMIASSANAQALPLIASIDEAGAFPVRQISRILKYIRSRRYDYLFDCSQWARLGNILCALSGAGCTTGFATRGQWRSLGYDHLAEHGANCHELDNFIALGRAVWPDFTGNPALKVNAGSDIRGFGDMAKTIFCHMWPARGKGRELKQWPEDMWAGLARELTHRGFRICLTGGPADSEANREFIRTHFKGNENVQSLAGETTLSELALLLTKGAALVSVNTGIMHLGALLDVPTIGLHGATNPLRWGPVGKRSVSLLPKRGERAYLNLGFEYPAHASNSMVNLPVKDVLDALRDLKVF